MLGDTRGDSEVLGTLLIALVIVALVSLIGVVAVFPAVTGTATPVVDFSVSVTPTYGGAPATVAVDHEAGDALDPDDMLLVVRGPDGDELRIEFADGTLPGSLFEEGDHATFDLTGAGGAPLSVNVGDRVEVLVVHRPSNELLYSGEKLATLPAAELGRRLVWSSAADWDAGTGENVLHDDVGDRRATRLQLGTYDETDNSLVGYFTLDEDGGAVVTDVTRNNDGTLKDESLASYDALDYVPGVYGGTAYWFEPQPANAFVSVERGAYVDLSDGTSPLIAGGSFTWSAWVKVPPTAGNKDAILTANNADKTNNVLWFICKNQGGQCMATGESTSDSRIVLYDEDARFAFGGPKLNDDRWRHVAVTLDATTGESTYWVDGAAVHTHTTTSRIAATDLMSIGQDYDDNDYGFDVGTSDFFRGGLDEVRIYNRVLTPGEIGELGRLDGRFVSAGKRFDSPVSGDDLELAVVDATLPAGASATVTVQADGNDDGDFDDPEDLESDPLDLTTSDRDVTFSAPVDASRYRVVVEMATALDDASVAPFLDRVDLRRTD